MKATIQCQFSATGEQPQCPLQATRKWGDHWFCDEHGARAKEQPMAAKKTLEELEKLPDDELRVMLAKMIGWTGIRGTTGYPSAAAEIAGNYYNLPNYPGDLNACHEVVQNLTREQTSHFETRLADLSGTYRNAINTPPRQRTIALILTLQ